jgi:hypothetical protein
MGVAPTNIPAKAKRRGMTSQQYMEQETGWKYDPETKLYYPNNN